MTGFERVIEIHSTGDRVFLRSILDSEVIDYFIQGETVAPYIFNFIAHAAHGQERPGGEGQRAFRRFFSIAA